MISLALPKRERARQPPLPCRCSERLLATRKPGPRILIVVPTRELASQINGDIRTLAQYTHIKTATIFGGVSARPQMTALRAQPEIIVACPGRLLDLFQQGAVPLHRIETLVLDEADHMFDLGFLPDVRRILCVLPKRPSKPPVLSDHAKGDSRPR